MEPPRIKEDVIAEIRELMKTGRPEELQAYVKKYPGFAYQYVANALLLMQATMVEIEMITLHLGKAQTDNIMANHRSETGGIPVDLSSL